MGRRDFLSLAGRGALWATLGASVVALVRFLSFTEPELPARFTLERTDAYALGTLTPVAEGRAFIGRDAQGLYAVIAACTHLGCRVTREEQALACPCHGSRFDTSGVVLQGPAARPLARAALTLGLEGRVELDLGQIVDAEYRLPLPSPFQQETPT